VTSSTPAPSPAPSPAQGDDPVATLTAIVADLQELVQEAKAVPLSVQVRVPRDRLVALVDELSEAVPHQLDEADRVLEDADRVLAEAHEQAEDVLSTARARAIELVQREQVVAQAQARAAEIVDDAHSRATRIKQDADDYCDRRLASLEEVLGQAGKQVRAGRERLAERSARRALEHGVDWAPVRAGEGEGAPTPRSGRKAG
jgi:vacuolar-type H+-ATPase subunit H